MRRLDLDFFSVTPPDNWASWMLLLAGAALCAEMGYSYFRADDELSTALQVIAANEASLPKDLKTREQAAQNYSAELDRARATISRIATPWDRLFKGIESVDIDSIAVLSLEPDAQAHTLNIRGKARDLAALLTYVARLKETKPFSNVILLNHQFPQDDPQRQVLFSLTAHWAEQ